MLLFKVRFCENFSTFSSKYYWDITAYASKYEEMPSSLDVINLKELCEPSNSVIAINLEIFILYDINSLFFYMVILRIYIRNKPMWTIHVTHFLYFVKNLRNSHDKGIYIYI